jgi:hypothetical protein
MATMQTDLLFLAGRYVLLLFAFVALAWTFARSRSAAKLDAERLFEQIDIAISRMHVLEESIADQHARLEQLLQSVESQTRITAAATSAPAQRQYETAIRLARAGSSREELMASCGVTRHEADLLLRLHAPRAQRSETPVTQTTPEPLRPAPAPARLAAVV